MTRRSAIPKAVIVTVFDEYSWDTLDHSPEPFDFTSVDAQEDFQSIKDSVQKVKLPPELKLDESKQGIKREDQQTLNVLSRTARYAETTLKVLSTFDDIQYNESVDNKLAQIVKIQQAQICYLRDEYANLIVQSKFDKSTSQTFRALHKNTSGLNPQALQNLKLASAISASASVPSKEAVTPRPRDSWRNNNSERGYGRRFFFPWTGKPTFKHQRYNVNLTGLIPQIKSNISRKHIFSHTIRQRSYT